MKTALAQTSSTRSASNGQAGPLRCAACSAEHEFEELELLEEVGRRAARPPKSFTRPRKPGPGKPARPRTPPAAQLHPHPHRRPAVRASVSTSGVRITTPDCVCPEHGSEAVRWAQSSLNRLRGLRLPLDGVMSAATRSALRAFQEERGLPADGILGPYTEEALRGAPSAAAAVDPAPEATEGEAFELLDAELEEEVNRSSRDYVRWVQIALNRILGLGLDVDGVSGPMTRAAVRSFQSRKGLEVDGVVGPNTESALIAAGAGQPPTSSAPPGVPVPVDTALPERGTGFYSYTSADKRHGAREAIAALTTVAATWASRHPRGPRVGIGDISLSGGGPMPGHGTHREGLNVDVRPVRSDGVEGRTSYREASYSRALTQELVDLFRANAVLPVSSILFNDPGVRGVKPFAGHDNHLHVNFGRPVRGAPAAITPGASTPPAYGPPSGVGTLPGRIVAVAIAERQRWKQGLLGETDAAAAAILIDYWKNGIGLSEGDARAYVDRRNAWSAAFISWVMKRAGAGSAFAYSSYHSTYLAAAYQNARAGAGASFKAYELGQTPPRLGDVVVTTYDAPGGRPPAQLSRVAPNTAGYHGDIVIGLENGQITLVGGNVSDTVGLKKYPVELLSQKGYFALVRA